MEIIKIQKTDLTSAGIVLTQAFRKDPIFHYIFGTKERYDKLAPWLFTTWVNWSVKYGKAWMTEDRNSVLLMRALGDPGMSFSSMVGAGMLPTPVKLGWTSFRRFFFEIVTLLERKNREIMDNIPHWYGWMVAVKPECRGMGKIILNHCWNVADENNLPIYLETSTEKNVGLYEYMGFELRDQIHISNGDFDLFFMVRAPQNQY